MIADLLQLHRLMEKAPRKDGRTALKVTGRSAASYRSRFSDSNGLQCILRVRDISYNGRLERLNKASEYFLLDIYRYYKCPLRLKCPLRIVFECIILS